MRISDWSSDVCSSDLAQERYNNKDVTEGVFESDSVGFDEEVARRGDGRRLAHFDNPAASSAVERTEEQDSRDSRDVSFNGDVTWLISDDTSLRSDEHTSELQSLMRISYAVFCLKKKTHNI